MTSPSPSNTVQRLTWLLLAVALLAAVWLSLRASRARLAPTVELSSAVPAGPELLLTVDVAALGSAAAGELLQAGGGTLLGLREQCGFEPLLGLRQVALSMPRAEPGQASDFAVIAQTTFQPEPVLRCAETVMRKRGGNPRRSSLGAFTSVRDQNRPLGEVAMRADGLFVMSGGKYFRDVIDSASGNRAADEAQELRSRVHSAVRGKLGPGQIALSLLVGPRLPLPGVQALGLGLDVQRDVQLRGYVACVSAPGCFEAANLIEQSKQDAARESGIAGLAKLRIEQHEQQLQISGRLARRELAPLLRQLLAP